MSSLFYSDSLKAHSHLCDCTYLDTSFSHFEKSLPQPEIKVHLVIRFIFRSVLPDFQSSTEKLFWVSSCSSCDINFIMISGSKQYLSRLCYLQISYEMVQYVHVMRMCLSWLCPFKEVKFYFFLQLEKSVKLDIILGK